MRQNSTRNIQKMISMEEYLEKRKRLKKTERKNRTKTACCRTELSAAVAMAELYI